MKNSKLLLKQIEQAKNPNYASPPRPRLITNNPNGWNDAIANPPQKTDGYLVKYGCVGACLSDRAVKLCRSRRRYKARTAKQSLNR